MPNIRFAFCKTGGVTIEDNIIIIPAPSKMLNNILIAGRISFNLRIRLPLVININEKPKINKIQPIMNLYFILCSIIILFNPYPTVKKKIAIGITDKFKGKEKL